MYIYSWRVSGLVVQFVSQAQIIHAEIVIFKQELSLILRISRIDEANRKQIAQLGFFTFLFFSVFCSSADEFTLVYASFMVD